MRGPEMALLQTIASRASLLQDELCRFLAEWTDEPPPLIIGYGGIGQAIAENLNSFSQETRNKIFADIECGMTNSDEAVATATATGLVEALVAVSDKDPTLWLDLERMLGPESLKYAKNWRDFGR
jgi:hypothetical protein